MFESLITLVSELSRPFIDGSLHAFVKLFIGELTVVVDIKLNEFLPNTIFAVSIIFACRAKGGLQVFLGNIFVISGKSLEGHFEVLVGQLQAFSETACDEF